MRYLAQVYHNQDSNVAYLKLLAHEESAYTWKVLKDERSISLAKHPKGLPTNLSSLVLAELSGDTITHLEDATHWLLELIQNYLTIGVTPAFLKVEAERAEQWRQSLTLQSQELGRRALELETRLGQIQELEEKLKQEQQAFDRIRGTEELQ